jgi:23S rRNA pseudouridine2605 synthase
MAKKSKKISETEGVEPVVAETEVAAEPQAKPKAKTKPKAETKPKAKKAAKRVKKAVDPIADETDGEAKTALEAVAKPVPEAIPVAEAAIEPAEDTAEDAMEAKDAFEAATAPDISDPDTDLDSEEDEPESTRKPRPPAKLERLQKILAQAGVASRRKAEEMIEQGRVQVNGKVVTALGTKADAGRDHVRVDGKLLQGAERLRYFVLNKPKGFVTTVKDPEGRPTVMQFFDKMRERLYPVGRLDYMSEGLLLVTNDGELANRLTRAAAGVEKTYLVKVAGVPSEAELDQLRAGVAIERGKPGSDRVRTSPARIRQVRQGDNPWYEVVLIEGRNRELRKMFEEVGHFVEKIRRVGYGPLILDQEPGNLRELDERELTLLRMAADGTLRTPKSKEIRRRNEADKQLPTVLPKPSGRPAKQFGAKPFAPKSFEERPALGPKDYRPKRAFEAGSGTGSGETARPSRPAGKDFGPPRPAWKKDDRSSRPAPRFGAGASGESRPPAGKPFADRPATGRTFGARPAAGRTYGDKPAGRSYGDKPAGGRAYGPKSGQGRDFTPKPGFKKPEGQQWPPYKRPPVDRPAPARRETTPHDDDFGPVKPPNLHIEEIKGPDRSSPARSSSARPGPARSGPPRPFAGRPSAGRPGSDRPFTPRPDRPSPERSSSARPSSPRPPSRPGSGRSSAGSSGSGRSSSYRASSDRPSPDRTSSARPFRSEGGLARPFTTSSGKPRAGGARPNNKSGAPAVRSSSVGWKSGSKPYGGAPKRSFDGKPGGAAKRPFRREEGEGSFSPRPPRSDSGPGQRPAGKPGWKPKPSFGGKGKPGAGGKSRPPFKSGPKPASKRPGSFGKKRP